MKTLALSLVLPLCAVLFLGRFVAGQQAPAVHSPEFKVGYVMLGVAGIQQAVDFYNGKLGLKVTRRSDDVAFFSAGPVSIAVSSEVGREPGDSEVVFAVDHVQGAYEALVRAGVKFDSAPHSLNAKAWVANFRDPDGHRLSVYGPQ